MKKGQSQNNEGRVVPSCRICPRVRDLSAVVLFASIPGIVNSNEVSMPDCDHNWFVYYKDDTVIIYHCQYCPEVKEVKK